ncbi:hypothetical protein HanIR_Chr13g0631631 [Helianthus annuus]|nr:hypothetical protein HanIR_Chr13g0631631 [Helianthus annuus]
MSTTFILHIFVYLLVALSPLHVESAGRGHGPIDIVKNRLSDPKVQDFVTRKGLVFHGKEVSGCMPKGRRRSSAPSRYGNNQPLLHTFGCSTVARP